MRCLSHIWKSCYQFTQRYRPINVKSGWTVDDVEWILNEFFIFCPRPPFIALIAFVQRGFKTGGLLPRPPLDLP